MESDVQPNNEQNMDPMEYLNSISVDSNSNVSETPGISGTMPVTPKNKKWPIILLIVLVVVLIVIWLVAVVVGGNVPEEGNVDEQDTEEMADVTYVTLNCDKSLDSTELNKYNSAPLSGTRNYFLIYDNEGLAVISQHTELAYANSELAEEAAIEESDDFEDYYKDELGLSEDPFDSSFRHLMDDSIISIKYDVEKNEMNLDDTGRFDIPGNDKDDVEDARAFYERAGYVCFKQ